MVFIWTDVSQTQSNFIYITVIYPVVTLRTTVYCIQNSAVSLCESKKARTAINYKFPSQY